MASSKPKLRAASECVQQNHKPLTAFSVAFAEAYARSLNISQAAVDAGAKPRLALSIGMALVAKTSVQRAIVEFMPDGDEKDEFEANWSMNYSDPTEDIIERIDRKREALALARRGGLPEPSEIIINRRPLGRRALAKIRSMET